MAGIVAMTTTVAAYADSIGTVDYDKVFHTYNKALSFSDDSKIKQENIQQMQAEYVKQLREAKASQSNNPVAYEQLEKDLQGKLDTEVNAYRDWYSARSAELDKDLDTAIQSVAHDKKLDVVVAKQVVLLGGEDITNDVLSILNANSTPPASSEAKSTKK